MTTTVSTPDPSDGPLPRVGWQAHLIYINSLPPDHPERIAWHQSLADMRAAANLPTEGDANP